MSVKVKARCCDFRLRIGESQRIIEQASRKSNFLSDIVKMMKPIGQAIMQEILVMDCRERESFWMTLHGDYKILFAATVREGLDLISENVGLVFLNLRMPDSNGLEALRLIKKNYPTTAVIIITSCGKEEYCMEAFRKGAEDYIQRPLNAEDALRKIKTLVNVDNVSRKRMHALTAMESQLIEQFPHVPSHMLLGVIRVRDFVTENYSELLTLSAACKMASISRTYFCRFFKIVTGHSLRKFHHVVRICKAEDLLKDKSLSITEIALRLGYGDSNYFSTIYKRITGVSPRNRRELKIDLDKSKEVLEEVQGSSAYFALKFGRGQRKGADDGKAKADISG